MFPLFLMGLLMSVGPAVDAALLAELDNDFEALVKNDPNAEQVRKAARQLEALKESSRPKDYLPILLVLRKTRSKAGIPLLLKYIHKHADFANYGYLDDDYFDTLAALTGKNESAPPGILGAKRVSLEARRDVAELVVTWWRPGKETITTDLERLSRGERRIVGTAFIREQAIQTGNSFTHDRSLAFELSQKMTAFPYAEPQCEHRQRPLAIELHPSVLPALLADCAKSERTDADDPSGWAKDGYFRFDITPVLALMYANGKAPELPKIAADNSQTVAARLTCLLALNQAGKDLKVDKLLPLLKCDCRQENKLLAVLLLARCVDCKDAVPTLLQFLNGKDEELRSAAILTLRSTGAPKEALPALKKVLDSLRPAKLVRPALRVLANMHSEEANAILVHFLKSTMDDKSRSGFMRDALAALEEATGKDWTSPIRSGIGSDLQPPDVKDSARWSLEEWERCH